jgi:CdiI N-terminal domain
MSFDLKLVENGRSKQATYKLELNGFSEEPILMTDYWSTEQYVRQWREAIDRLINEESNESQSALVTAIHDPIKPQYGYVVHWWPLYKRSTSIFVHEASIPFEPKEVPLNLHDLYSYIPSRETKEGNKPSEWEIDLQDLKDWRRNQLS